MNDPARGAFLTLVEQIRGCTLCPLSETRTKAVPGEGNEDADVMFIGEAPGLNEDRQGRPFVGAAGGVLDQLLSSIGLARPDVYICNMLKCRPPENRDPLEPEIESCSPYLDRQIELVDPSVIVTLGRHSFRRFFPGESIKKSRGMGRPWRGRVVYPVYHPAAVLHNPRLREALEEDFLKLPELMAVGRPAPDPVSRPQESAQLGMDLGGGPSARDSRCDPGDALAADAGVPDLPRQGQLL